MMADWATYCDGKAIGGDNVVTFGARSGAPKIRCASRATQPPTAGWEIVQEDAAKGLAPGTKRRKKHLGRQVWGQGWLERVENKRRANGFILGLTIAPRRLID